MLQALLLLSLLGNATGWATTASPVGVALDRSPERVVSLSVPAQSREPPTTALSVHGPWRVVQTVDGVRTWETSLPVRPRTLFYQRAPPSMKLARVNANGKPSGQTYKNTFHGANEAGTWAASPHSLQVRRPISEGPPTPGEYNLRYPRAIDREKSLNRKTAKAQTDAEFVFRSVQIDDTNRHGLLLPAPSEITFALPVTDESILRFEVQIVPPEAAIGGQVSDGAIVTVLADSGQGEQEVFRGDVTSVARTVQIDLGGFAGDNTQLRIMTEPGPSSLLDYVFLSQPTVWVPEEDPPRTVVIFIDTLRPDHMSLYGYERNTSPAIDKWAEGAAVFSQARSVAPWTLPATRTMLTGAQPERWKSSARLQDLYAASGWATGFFAGNVYLSSNFEMAEGWGEHRCINWPQASVQVDRTIDFLNRNRDRAAFVVLHMMDMHLPYTEPPTYRHIFAGETPAALGGDYFLRQATARAARSMGEEGKQYVRDRYDNNLRYVDHHVSRVLDRMGPKDTVIIVSDHGEEFWDHGGFEHGHSLYDELLRIPLAVRGPSFTPGTFDTPVSLLDVAPTLAAQAGLSTMGMVGWDLRALADGTRTTDFAERPQAFGRPLYGLRRWGSLHNGQKYLIEEGKERLFDLRTDPAEKNNRIADSDPQLWRDAMATALDRPVVQAWRLVPSRTNPKKPMQATIQMEQPVTAAWAGLDPTLYGKADVKVTEDSVIARWPKQRSRVEVFVVPPVGPAATEPIPIVVQVGNKTESFEIVPTPLNRTGKPRTFLKASVGGRSLLVSSTVVPVPSDADGAIVGFDAEVAEDLKSIGYVGD